MADDGAIHLRKTLHEALAAEAARLGVSVDALVEEAVERHIEEMRTFEHFARLRAQADWSLFDRVIGRVDGEPPQSDDTVPTMP